MPPDGIRRNRKMPRQNSEESFNTAIAIHLWTWLFLLALLLGLSACVGDARRRVVSSPAQNGIVLAPDVYTLIVLMTPNAAPPPGLIAIPNGTKGLGLSRKFLKEGKLVDPYPANNYDMEREGAVEVVLFQVTEGPLRGARGWVQAWFLRPDFRYL